MSQQPEAISVLSEPQRVARALPPLRRRLLEHLQEPESAAGLARRLELPRQKVNYHLRQLEHAGLVELVDERQRRGCVERRFRVKARSFCVSPALLGGFDAEPTARDRFSSAYLLAATAATLRDAALLRERARAAGKPLATLTVQSEVAFASPADFRSFSEELAQAAARLAEKYHRPDVAASRPYRLLAACHPKVTKTEAEALAEAENHRGDDHD